MEAGHDGHRTLHEPERAAFARLLNDGPPDGRSGRLIWRQRGHSIELDFAERRLVAVWTDVPRLAPGVVLVRHGLAPSTVVRHAEVAARASGRDLAMVLREQNLLSGSRLRAALYLFAGDLLVAALECAPRSCQWQERGPRAESDTRVEFEQHETRDLVRESVRRARSVAGEPSLRSDSPWLAVCDEPCSAGDGRGEDSTEALFQLGVFYKDRGRPELAATLFRRALAAQRDHTPARRELFHLPLSRRVGGMTATG